MSEAIKKRLLVVSNLPSDNTRRLADSVVLGASHDDIENVTVQHLETTAASAKEILASDGLILGTTENFGYMSGLMKDFLERIYYPCLDETQGKPYALYVRAGNDGEGAKTSVERIVTGLRWNPIRPTLIMTGDFQDIFLDQCEELGLLMAAGLDAGIY